MKKCLVIDLDRCTGCDTCVVACKFENNVSLGRYWNRVLTMTPQGTWPNVEEYWLPVQCQQCENPQCVHVCPTGASYRDKDTNVVLIDKSKCIGCQFCVMACPYGVRQFNDTEGVVEKCTLCPQRTANGEAPACVHNCCNGARLYGDLDDPDSDVSKAIAEAEATDGKSVYRLPDPGNSKPATAYIMSDKVAHWKELKELK